MTLIAGMSGSAPASAAILWMLLRESLPKITANPARYGFANADIREGVLTRFPYAIYYRVLADRIRVLAVYHTSRDPSRWQSRA
jgi:toxin ParE1/3/4